MGEDVKVSAVQGRLEEAKRASWSQLMVKSARLLDEYLLTAMGRERPEIRALRRTHLMLFPHIPLAGARLTHLAQCLGVSKQAVGQLVDELEEMGMVERVKDPQDGRAKLVRFVQGGELLIAGVEEMRQAELELERGLAPGEGDLLREILPRLITELERALARQGE